MARERDHEGKSKIGRFVASIVELFDREIKTTDDRNIYKNDIDNLYPNRVELVERNSVTAFSCSQKLKSFIVGKGFADESLNEMIVNPVKKLTGYKVLSLIANSIKTHRGAFIHVNYDIDGNVNYLDVLNYKKCRISKEDDLGYNGLIYYKDWNEKGKRFDRKDDKCKWFYPFNRNPTVIINQRIKDAKLNKKSPDDLEALVRNYRGQVYFLSLDDTEIYPYGWVHPVYNDADNEYRISLYRNSNLRTGFLGKTMIIPNGLDEESMNEFDAAVKGWLGAENSGSVFVMKPKEQVDNLENVIRTVELKSNYDSKRFETDEKSIENNIRKAYLSIPKILIAPEDSFFGSSGEAFIQAVEYYNEETLFIRDIIAYTMESFYPKTNFTIRQLNTDDTKEVEESAPEVSPETAQAQAALRGSVGGVQGILGIQQSVSNQLTDFESAITILMEIYGFTSSVSAALLGQPEIKEDNGV